MAPADAPDTDLSPQHDDVVVVSGVVEVVVEYDDVVVDNVGTIRPFVSSSNAAKEPK